METATAIELAGSTRKLALLLGVERASVQSWQRKGVLPEQRVLQFLQLRPGWFKPVPLIEDDW